MKNPHRASEGAGKTQQGADRDSVALGTPCPYASDCRTRLTYITGTETAACGHCCQILNRADLSRLLETAA